MKTMTRTGFLAALFVLPFLLTALPLQAQSADLKARMAARLPQVDSLKKAGLVGENNRGLLEGRGSLSSEQSATVSAENKDRAALYSAIAQSRGVSTTDVAKARAADIREKARGNVWVQAADGAWKRMP